VTAIGPECVLITGAYGPGKSSVAAELAYLLEHRGELYALLDLDYLCWADAGSPAGPGAGGGITTGADAASNGGVASASFSGSSGGSAGVVDTTHPGTGASITVKATTAAGTAPTTCSSPGQDRTSPDPSRRQAPQERDQLAGRDHAQVDDDAKLKRAHDEPPSIL
jgi:hypothetical protein